jgi:prophage regulatory protein
MPRNIIRKPEVYKRTGLSDTQIWRLERDQKFPHRIQLSPSGMAVGWYEDEVEAWVHSRVRAGGRQPPLPKRRRPGVINGAAPSLDLAVSIDGLELSAHTMSALIGDRINTLAKLVQKTASELLAIPRLGKVSLAEIQSMLRQRGLHLGMEPQPPAPQPVPSTKLRR